MSISDVRALALQMEASVSEPLAWVLIANPVWGRAEDMNAIALFDSKEAALNYARQSALPEPFRGPDKIYRTHRPDSLLYDYNGGEAAPCKGTHGRCYCMLRVVPMLPWIEYGSIVENPMLSPLPPGTIVRAPDLTHARYGTDYDVGWGPPPGGYTDTSREVPTAHPLDSLVVAPPALPEPKP